MAKQLSLFHRCEVEIVEGECLPASTRGGKPDPFCVISYPDHPSLKHRTRIVANTDVPVFGQKFVVEAKTATTQVDVQVFDRSEDPDTLLATGSVEVGPPSREVGCRWLVLKPARASADGRAAELAPKVRIVWQCADVMLASEQVTGAAEGESVNLQAARAAEASTAAHAPEVTAVSHVNESTGSITTTSGPAATTTSHAFPDSHAMLQHQHGSAQDPSTVSPVQAQLLTRLVSLEDTMRVFMDDMKGRVGRIEQRLGAVEAYISGHGGSAKGARPGEEAAGSYWATRASQSAEDSIAASGDVSTRIAVTGEGTNAVAKLASKGPSALDQIRQAPTRVAAEDERLVANYTFPSVHVPKPMHKDGAARPASQTSGSDAMQASKEDDRRLEATTRAVNASYKRMVTPL
jgi:hypothetical protein